MATFVGRASLSRQRRKERIEAARQELTAFLDTLDPLLRKYLVAPEPLTIEEANQVWLHVSPARESQRHAARLEYERLLFQIPDEWNRHCKRQVPGYKLVTEFRLRGQVPRRGAPKKLSDDSEDALVAQKVNDARLRLKDGCELRHQLKAATLLNPVVLMTAINRLADELVGEQPAMTSSTTRELVQVEAELARLASAVAAGGELASLVRAIQDREARRNELQATLATLARAREWTADRAVIVEELTARLTDWRALLEEQSGQANRLLRQVLVGKVTMTPGEDGYRFKGTGTVQPIVAGLVPHNLASPTGFDTSRMPLFSVCLGFTGIVKLTGLGRAA